MHYTQVYTYMYVYSHIGISIRIMNTPRPTFNNSTWNNGPAQPQGASCC